MLCCNIPKEVVEKPIEMANIIIELQQENKILKENAKNNDKVVDKVNWENMLLKKENKQLKQKYENAVADYETTMFEKEQLNSLVNSCQEEIRQLKKQQQEFINYLEDEIKFHKNRDSYMVADILGSYDLNDIKLKLLKEILQKYKEIIGVSDEKK